jgi:hypothetical protein
LSADPTSVIPEAIIFATIDSQDTGRPIRVTLSNLPKDYDPILIADMGGYKEIQFVAHDI